jgi:Spy/CpxP family protein refolding chaperone
MNHTAQMFRKAVLAATMFAALPFSASAQMPMSSEEMQQMMQERQQMYGGWGMGPGMMRGGMMWGGPGMGMGPGMMMGGGSMMGMGGMGMMGLHGIYMLDLTDEQRGKINAVQDALRKQHWEIMGKMMDQHNALRDLYDADTLDAKAIGAAYDKIFDLKRQLITAGIEAHNKARAALTKEQLAQLKTWRRGGPMGPGAGYGPGNMPRGMGSGMMGR